MSIAKKKDIRLQIHVCNALHNREWLRIDNSTKKIKIWKYKIQVVFT